MRYIYAMEGNILSTPNSLGEMILLPIEGAKQRLILR